MFKSALVSIWAGLLTMMLVFSAYAAGAGSAQTTDWMRDWIPFIGSSLGGITLALLTMIPAVRKTGFLFMEAVLELNKFMSKYDTILQGEVRADFMKVLMKFDQAFDLLASIMGRVGAKKLGSFLQDIIKSEWFQKQNTRS